MTKKFPIIASLTLTSLVLAGCQDKNNYKDAETASIDPNLSATIIGIKEQTPAYGRAGMAFFMLDTDGNNETAEYVGYITGMNIYNSEPHGRIFNASNGSKTRKISEWGKLMDGIVPVKEKE